MKLKSIASLCKGRKMADIYTDRCGNQYLGNGSAYYLMPAELELDSSNILIIFDVPQEKRDEWMIHCGLLPQYLPAEDIIENETPAKIIQLELCLGDDIYRMLKDDNGIIIFNTKYLAPLSDINDPISYYIRRISADTAFIAVKKGLMLMALIEASNARVFTDDFLGILRDVEDKVADWMNRSQEPKVNLETGEVEGL